MNKQQLLSIIISHLQQELSTLQTAANNAHLAAIDDQSVAETQYDTLAIEAGYLAEGQSRRVLELKLALQQFNTLATEIETLVFDENSELTTGALIQLAQGKSKHQWYFLAPAAAGFKTTLTTDSVIDHITVITEKSPMGQALAGLYLGDDMLMQQGNNTLQDAIIDVR